LAKLATLRAALESQSKPDQAEQVLEGEQEAASGNGPNALHYLKKAGSWAL